MRMYDDVTIDNIPSNAKAIACYVDGLYANHIEAKKKRPKAKLKTITVLGGRKNADIGDCETGDMTPEGAAKWAAGRVRAHQRPTIYCNASTWPAVLRAVRAEGIAGKVDYLIAQYDGKRLIPRGAIGKQYLGYPGNSPGPYDVSNVRRSWLYGKSRRWSRWVRRHEHI